MSTLEVTRFDDIINTAAGVVLERWRENLPDLRRVKVIVPNPNMRDIFRFCLAESLPHSQTGILPPWCGTLTEFIEQAFENKIPDDKQVLSDEARRLLFIDILSEHPQLYKSENKWQVTSDLLSFFDELYLSNPDILACSQEEWISQLATAYKTDSNFKQVRDEAQIIHTLWVAWQSQLAADGLIDSVRAYTENLTRYLSEDNDDEFVFVSTDIYTPVEKKFIDSLNSNALKIDVDRTKRIEDSATDIFINSVFHTEIELSRRIEMLQAAPRELPLPIKTLPAENEELEAAAVDLQVRRWLIDGVRQIAIISENRKLSRRVRALLERADVRVQDISGWSLATTSAAAALESWLQCLDDDFQHNALLDLLKSPFFVSDEEFNFHLQSVYRLENDIIVGENVSSNLASYQQTLSSRESRLGHWSKENYDHVRHLLRRLATIAEPLLQRINSQKKIPLQELLTMLSDSLEQLGIESSFSEDEAGEAVLAALDDMGHAFAHADPLMLWEDFRTWLSLLLESILFTPQTDYSAVTLLTLQQAEHQKFDAIIIASMDKEFYPGKPDTSPFFNQSVRAALGLSDWQLQRDRRQEQFLNLLCSSDNILITYRSMDQGEPLQLSPWLKAIEDMIKLTDREPLIDTRLKMMLQQGVSVSSDDPLDLPRKTAQPSLPIPADLLPKQFSARSHQSLIDCPYQFFSSDALSLRPTDTIVQELQKSDYGSIIHRVLQTFHVESKSRFKPFVEPIDDLNREKAEKYLTEISEYYFRKDIEDNILHKSWLYRWKKQIPKYIDWQMSQAAEWSIDAAELELRVKLLDDISLYGRIDRVDSQEGRKMVIDYKTGSVARQQDVESAEEIQLTTYALLDDDISTVAYVSVDGDKGVRTAVMVEDEQLDDLKNSVRSRLKTVVRMVKEQYPVTAWGDDVTCSYCHYEGICRRSYWIEEDTEETKQ